MSKDKKNCLLVFRNKKINIFDGAEKFIRDMSGHGYYFDKISYIAYDSSDDIVGALKDGKEGYENLFIYCPASMENTLKSYLTLQYCSDFDERGILQSNRDSVFLLYSDRQNTLQLPDIKSELDAKYGIGYQKSVIKAYGATVAQINSVIGEAKAKCNAMDFCISESFGDFRIEITYPDNLPKVEYDDVARIIVSGLQEYVYAMDDISLAERLYQLLKLRKVQLSLAESFTGGGIGKKLVEIPGVSEVYLEGLNTYSNFSKIIRLGVSEFTLDRFGAVSEQVAREMAEGSLKSSGSNISIATTGIAGPTSDGTHKPIGLVYIAVAFGGDCSVYEYKLDGDREKITNTSINLALFKAYKILK